MSKTIPTKRASALVALSCGGDQDLARDTLDPHGDNTRLSGGASGALSMFHPAQCTVSHEMKHHGSSGSGGHIDPSWMTAVLSLLTHRSP